MGTGEELSLDFDEPASSVDTSLFEEEVKVEPKEKEEPITANVSSVNIPPKEEVSDPLQRIAEYDRVIQNQPQFYEHQIAEKRSKTDDKEVEALKAEIEQLKKEEQDQIETLDRLTKECDEYKSTFEKLKSSL